MTPGISIRIGLRRRSAVWALALGGAVLAVGSGDAHNPLISKYTYNDHVFPILRDKCGACHVSAGVAPMSLMTFKDALPWSESIRTELMSMRMPPWDADVGVGAFRHTAALSARELDVVLTWATGGNPPGDPDHPAPAVTLQNDWRLGPPDLALPLPTAVTLGPGTVEETREFTIATGTSEDRGLRAVDVLPGTPAIVSSASVSVKPNSRGDESRTGFAAERLLAQWVPGQGAEALDPGVAFRLPAGADLIVRIHYKKTWAHERESLTDRSTVGLYFAPPSSSDVRTFALHSLDNVPADGRALAFGRVIDEDVQVLAFHLESPLANASVKVDAALADGSRLSLIHFKGISGVSRRYWSADPIRLPRGTRIEVTAMGRRGDLLPPLSSPATASGLAIVGPVHVTLDVVPIRNAGSGPTTP
jgi:hypothetical protein